MQLWDTIHLLWILIAFLFVCCYLSTFEHTENSRGQPPSFWNSQESPGVAPHLVGMSGNEQNGETTLASEYTIEPFFTDLFSPGDSWTLWPNQNLPCDLDSFSAIRV